MQYRAKSTDFWHGVKAYLSVPFIWGLSIPVVILHIFAEIYHQIAFRLYGIDRVKTSDYIRIDRQHLSYLSPIEKINCMYCGYVNGFCRYISEIAGRTELYWCAIKHSEKDTFIEPEHHKDFVEYGNKKALEGKYGYRGKTPTEGFTLIELMVVIAIIAILAIGGVSLYNAHIQKSEDSRRMRALKTFETVANAYYASESRYPTATGATGITTSVMSYSGVELYDATEGEVAANSGSGDTQTNYVYAHGPDLSNVPDGSFEVSTAFANLGNVTNFAANGVDYGDDDNRLEIGTLKTLGGADLDSSLSAAGVLGGSSGTAVVVDSSTY